MPGSWQPGDLPNLTDDNWVCTSPRTDDYNCIGWAAGDPENWWWPDEGFWPNVRDRELSVAAFVRAFATRGYEECGDGALEIGFEKIAIYAETSSGVPIPTHAARQLPDGRWTSKLGPLEDIEHTTLDAVNCREYGTAVRFMKLLKQN